MWHNRISFGPLFWHPEVSSNCAWTEKIFENANLGYNATYQRINISNVFLIWVITNISILSIFCYKNFIHQNSWWTHHTNPHHYGTPGQFSKLSFFVFLTRVMQASKNVLMSQKSKLAPMVDIYTECLKNCWMFYLMELQVLWHGFFASLIRSRVFCKECYIW